MDLIQQGISLFFEPLNATEDSLQPQLLRMGALVFGGHGREYPVL